MGRLTIFTINGAYLNQGVVAVNSYLRHNPDDEVMVFATTATQNALKYKEVFSKYKVAVVLLEPNDTSWFPNSYFCPVEVEGMCLRLKAIDYLAEHRPDVSRLFYLDSDIVVRTSLAGIWNAPLDNAYVAAALDYQRVQELPHLYRKHFDWNKMMKGEMTADVNKSVLSAIHKMTHPRDLKVMKKFEDVTSYMDAQI